jgi:arylsulfatase A-like enzyme
MQHSITRRKFLERSASVAGAFAAACSATPEPAAEESAKAGERPNFILLMGDDHGWDETGYNGHPYLKTPVLDEMAASGLRLDSFYSAHPNCSPTRASVLTGRHPNRQGTFAPNWSTRPEEITTAHILSKTGYGCGHFGKWHVGPVRADSPVCPGKMGFEEWLSHDNFFELDPYFSRNGGPPEQFKGESSEIVVSEAIRFIDKVRQSGRPFFTVVWFGSPHEPYRGLPEDLALYDNLPADFATRPVKLTSLETGLPVERPQREVLRERYAEITAMDRAIGKLREHLKSQGLKNTLVWYCGDNGVPPEARATTPFRAQKGQVYQGGIRVAGIIEWPERITQPRASSVNAVTSDMLPTICELAGAPLPDRPLDGVSLGPLVAGEMTERSKPICFWDFDSTREGAGEPYIEPSLQEGTTPLAKLMDGKATRSFRNYRHPQISEADFAGPRAIVDNRYKLVVDAQRGGGSSTELFDLSADRAEKTNIADANPQVVEDLGKQLREWQQSVLESLTGADYAKAASG